MKIAKTFLYNIIAKVLHGCGKKIFGNAKHKPNYISRDIKHILMLGFKRIKDMKSKFLEKMVSLFLPSETFEKNIFSIIRRELA